MIIMGYLRPGVLAFLYSSTLIGSPADEHLALSRFCAFFSRVFWQGRRLTVSSKGRCRPSKFKVQLLHTSNAPDCFLILLPKAKIAVRDLFIAVVPNYGPRSTLLLSSIVYFLHSTQAMHEVLSCSTGTIQGNKFSTPEAGAILIGLLFLFDITNTSWIHLFPAKKCN